MQGKQAVYGRCGCGASVFTAKGVQLDDLKPHDSQNAKTSDAEKIEYLDDEAFESENVPDWSDEDFYRFCEEARKHYPKLRPIHPAPLMIEITR